MILCMQRGSECYEIKKRIARLQCVFSVIRAVCRGTGIRTRDFQLPKLAR